MKPYIIGSSFATWLRDEMRRQDICTHALAKKAGVSDIGLTRIVRGDTQPTLKTVEKLVYALADEDQLCVLGAIQKKAVKK